MNMKKDYLSENSPTILCGGCGDPLQVQHNGNGVQHTFFCKNIGCRMYKEWYVCVLCGNEGKVAESWLDWMFTSMQMKKNDGFKWVKKRWKHHKWVVAMARREYYR